MKKKLLQTRFGILQGIEQDNVLGGKYLAFKGIPYAEPPVGQLRFQDPIPWTRKWKGVRDATQHGEMSIQYDRRNRVVIGSEDCLYLNVYTASLNVSCPRPVMVWIHGGAFAMGSGDDSIYGPDYLVRKDVVLVTINYRLDIFGFLNLGHETAPGNQGLKDQVMALRWVQENISNFTGDPRNVTIFGESAGGVSVHLITQSPLAQGLYDKVIIQSGSALNPWASMIGDPSIFGFKLAALLGKESDDPEEVLEFLRNINPIKLIEMQQKLFTRDVRIRYQAIVGPSLDSKSKNPFLIDPPDSDKLKRINVPLLIGHNSREGLFFLEGIREFVFKEYDLKFAQLLNPNFLNWLKRKKIDPLDLRKMYFENRSICSQTSLDYVDLMSDMQFCIGIHEIVKNQIDKNSQCPTYMYKFSYDSGMSFLKKLMNIDAPGACHFDEVQYLFHFAALEMLDLKSPKTDPKERRIMEIVTRMWTDFAKFGNPTPTTSKLFSIIWEPVNSKMKFRHLVIDETLYMDTTESYEQRFNLQTRKLQNKL